MIALPRSLAALALTVALAPATQAADVTDPAALFPPGTLAYAEVHDPAALAPQLAAVVRGTTLADSIPFIHNRRDAAKELRDLTGKEPLALLGLVASPEMVAEFKKLGGVAVGMTGYTPQGEPEVAAAVLTGDSQAAGLAARAFLTISTVRKVGAVGDVPVYQLRRPSISYDPNGRQVLQPGKPAEGPHEATFAYLPGLVVVGTSRAAVGEVVTRFQGKAADSLAGQPAFKRAAATYRQPGLFVYANAPEFYAKADAARRARPGTVEPDAFAWFRLVANAKAVQAVAGCARFRDGGLSVTLGVATDPAAKSPLRDALTGPAVKVEYLSHAPGPFTFAVTMTLPETDRAAAVVGFFDAMAKANGDLGRLPGEAVTEWEAKYKVPLTGGLLGKTRAVTVFLPTRQELPKGAWPLPAVVLHTESADVAAGWEEFLPKLVGDLAGANPPQPSVETLGGVKVLSLPGTELPWKAAVHYARKDAVIAIGLDRKLVAAAAAGGSAGTAPPAGDATLVGALAAGDILRLLAEEKRPDGPVVPTGPVAPVAPAAIRRGFEPPDGGRPVSDTQKKDEATAREALLKAVDGLPPAAVTARRDKDEIRFEVWLPKVQTGGLAPVVNAAVGLLDKLLDRGTNPNGREYEHSNDLDILNGNGW